MTRAAFLAKITALHAQFEFSETSSWRTARRNKIVGGLPNSKHLTGLAVDCVLDHPKDAPRFYAAIKKAGLRFLDEKDHIHVQS